MIEEPESRSLVTEFFITFSLFEFAMKKTGYLKDQKGAEPDWNVLAKAAEIIAMVENATGDLKEAIDYYLEKPPAKQMVEDGRLKYKEIKDVGAKSSHFGIFPLVPKVGTWYSCKYKRM